MSKTFARPFPWLLLATLLGYLSYVVHIHHQEYNALYKQPITFFDQTTQKDWCSTTCDANYVYRITRHRPYPKPIANRENVKGKTVFLYEGNGSTEWELGGFGDTFMFLPPVARLLKEYGAKKIIFELINASRIPMVQCCPYVDEIVLRGSTKPPQFDLHSRTVAFLIQDKTFPPFGKYFQPKQNLIEKWKNRLKKDKNLKIGICWQAGGTWDVKAFGASRSMQMQKILSLSDIAGVTLYSLQRLPNGSSTPKKGSLVVFDDLDKNTGPFMDTAALMKNLDLIISVDTSIPQLAGMLGKPVWILLTKNASWRWFDHGTKTTPWYPSAKLFWQKELGDWDNVLDEVKRQLEKLINN